MRFNPVARLDPGQIVDLRHNPAFMEWLTQNRMLSPFAQMQYRSYQGTWPPLPMGQGAPAGPMGNAQARALYQQLFGGR